ncbi:MAG TPA: 2-C-methyl-D-erythritol 2,4-cyclodiphosphate synthase [Firmicutes bacterium]|nr:2-C-methyl-D-erythritol 2,4-cyclodiphosphate synthase [Bacillota bacterium]
MGVPVWLVRGSFANLKITTPEDLACAEALLAGARGREERRAEVRVGTGYDVHRLVEGRPLVLGGVRVPHEKGLLGHSDADVLTHALMDALLGAAALGDLGQHFPDTDPAYAGADSLVLLREVVRKVTELGWRVANADAVVIAERPRLAPHLASMRERLAGALGCSVAAVSVKATTTEKLGFAGREEGIAAQAVCLLERRPER